MKNKNYKAEIIMANNFVIENNNNLDLLDFLVEMREKNYLSHSDRWSLCYKFLRKHFPAATGTLVTGLTYWLEQ